MRGPSSSSTIASTYGGESGKPFCPRWTTVNVCRVPRPLTGFQSMSGDRQRGHAPRG